MSKFNTFTINEPLATSFKTLFDNRVTNTPVVQPKGLKSSVYPMDNMNFAEWRKYIHDELKKDLVVTK